MIAPPLPSVLTIRLLRPSPDVSDLVQAHALYREHGGLHLPIPDPDILHDAVQDGQMFGCWTEEGRMVAAAGIFWLGRCRRPGELPVGVYELAGLVADPIVRGLRPYSLQDVLVAVRALALSCQQSTGLCLVSSVSARNRPSWKSLERCGLDRLDDGRTPLWLKDVRRTWLAGTDVATFDYVLPPRAMGGLRSMLADSLGLRAIQAGGTPDERQFQLRLGASVDLTTLLARRMIVPAWESDVPPQRLLGRQPPFIPWPRG